MPVFRVFHLPKPAALIEADDQDEAMEKYIENIGHEDFNESYESDYVAENISDAKQQCEKLNLDFSDIIEEGLMPNNIRELLEALNKEPRKNENEILELLRKHGTDECSYSEHKSDYETFDWKNLGSDDEFEHFEECLGCGGTRV